MYSDIIYQVIDCLELTDSYREIFILKVFILRYRVSEFIDEHREKYIDPYIYKISKYQVFISYVSGIYRTSLSNETYNLPQDVYIFIRDMIPQMDIYNVLLGLNDKYKNTPIKYFTMCGIARYYIPTSAPTEAIASMESNIIRIEQSILQKN